MADMPGTSQPASVAGLRRVAWTDLIGSEATPADQRKIGRTVVGICAADVWTRGMHLARGWAVIRASSY